MARTAGRSTRAWRPSRPARRWPWALAAVVAGAAAGGGTAYVVRRVRGQDRAGAVEPDQLRAVVDRPGEHPDATS